MYVGKGIEHNASIRSMHKFCALAIRETDTLHILQDTKWNSVVNKYTGSRVLIQEVQLGVISVPLHIVNLPVHTKLVSELAIVDLTYPRGVAHSRQRPSWMKFLNLQKSAFGNIQGVFLGHMVCDSSTSQGSSHCKIPCAN